MRQLPKVIVIASVPLLVALAGCAAKTDQPAKPTEDVAAIARAVAATLTAVAPRVTDTPEPTRTPEPSRTSEPLATATQSAAEANREATAAFKQWLGSTVCDPAKNPQILWCAALTDYRVVGDTLLLHARLSATDKRDIEDMLARVNLFIQNSKYRKFGVTETIIQNEDGTQVLAPGPGIEPMLAEDVSPVSTQTQTMPVVAGTTNTPQVVTDKAINLRSGPGTMYQVLGATKPGNSYEVKAKSPDGSWLQVCCVNQLLAWISAGLVTTEGDLAQVGIAQDIPPTPVVATNPQIPVPEGWLRYDDPAGAFSTYYPPGWSLYPGTGQNVGFTGVEIDQHSLTFFRLVDSPVATVDVNYGSVPIPPDLGGGEVKCANITQPKGNRHVEGMTCLKNVTPGLDIIAPFINILALVQPK